MDCQSYFGDFSTNDKMGMNMTGAKRETTLPASIGMFEPVESTDKVPNSVFAVTSQAINEHVKASGGLKVAAAHDCRSHILTNEQKGQRMSNTGKDTGG